MRSSGRGSANFLDSYYSNIVPQKRFLPELVHNFVQNKVGNVIASTTASTDIHLQIYQNYNKVKW